MVGAEAKHRRQFLAQQMRNFVAFMATKEDHPTAPGDQVPRLQATVLQVLTDMEVLTNTWDKVRESSQAAADFHKVLGFVSRLRTEFFPHLSIDGCPSYRSTCSSTMSPSLDSVSSEAVSPSVGSGPAGSEDEPLGPEGLMVVRVLEAVKEHLQGCHGRERRASGVGAPRGEKRGSLSLGELPDLICHLQAALDDAHRREAQFVRQSRDKYERTLALQTELKALQGDKVACAVAFSDALVRLGENLDFLAMLTHCDVTGTAGAVSEYVSLRFGALDAQAIKTAADIMVQRLRAVERKLRDTLCVPECPRRAGQTDLD
eukprot:TRINITY_DN152_c0_g1_i2.p1 TRINITY_DN152_c0_g1~~TRINITY_DN152_c0_g1_i2.p1  ORF type:complete len:342 (+),score=117.63 TRINITY_DN152_c0_g1_i2:76-1026(+)